MNPGNDEKLEALRRELEKQNEEWARLQSRLLQLGNVEIQVPAEVLAQLEDPVPSWTTHSAAAPVLGVRV